MGNKYFRKNKSFLPLKTIIGAAMDQQLYMNLTIYLYELSTKLDKIICFFHFISALPRSPKQCHQSKDELFLSQNVFSLCTEK